MGLLSKKKKQINKVVLIPLSEIQKSPNQPRKFFDPEELRELSQSIAVNGLLQPITVRKREDGQYELIAGERRSLAFRSLGKEYIPAIVEEFTDEQSAVLSMVENLQRKELNYMEEAMGIAKLMQELNLTQQQVSERLGKAQSTVANKLRLLKYSQKVQGRLLETGLTERHARALLKLQDESMQLEAIEYIASRNLNVEQAEIHVSRLLEYANEPGRPTHLFVVKDMRIFLNTIQKAVSMMNQAGIPVDTQKNENDTHMEFLIRVPKESIYKTGTSGVQRKKVV